MTLEDSAKTTSIDGLLFIPRRSIVDDRGSVFHLLRSDSEYFQKFGEVYISTVRPGVVKAWKKHLAMTQTLAVPLGRVRFVCFDDRPNSKTYKQIATIDLGQDPYGLLRIPPNVWYGFQGMSRNYESVIVNCADLTHDPTEVVRVDIGSGEIPYTWETP